MGKKVMLEAVQPVVDGNTVVHAAGDLFELGAAPDGVLVREVIVDAPDPKPEPAPAKPAPKPGK